MSNQSYSDRERKCAYEIAETLDDVDSLEFHLQNARMFSEDFLRTTLQKVLSIPQHKIKKSRAALYTYLINKHRGHGNLGH